MILRSLLIIPLASNHSQIIVTHCAEVGNHVVTAVDVSERGVERYIKNVELVVVAEKTLEESLIGKSEGCQVIVGAIHKCQIGATLNAKSGQVIVGAYEVKQIVAVADTESIHPVVAADERCKIGQT